MNHLTTRSLVLAATLLAATGTRADVLHVDARLTTGTGDGTSWANAYRGPLGLRDALAAAEQGDEIYLTAGTYYPGPPGSPQTTSFVLDGSIAIVGGFTGVEQTPFERPAPGLALTVLSGDLARDDQPGGVNRGDNARHVLVDGPLGSSAELDRLVVVGGEARVINNFTESRGGGVLLTGPQSRVRFRGCWFVDNGAQYGGAGVAVDDGAPRFEDCIFVDNHASSFGGGVFVATQQPVLLDRCRFEGNSSNFGGGLLVTSDSPTTLRNSLVVDNVALGTLGGGGVAVVGVPSVVLGPLRVEFCTVVENRSPASRSAGVTSFRGAVEVVGSIVWGNQDSSGLADRVSQVGGGIPVLGSLVQGIGPGGGNLNADPLFANAAGGDFRLSPGSPAIDAGMNALLAPGVRADGKGQRRRVDDPATPGVGPGAVVDMGAFEYAVGALGTVFCEASPNSTGVGGRVDAYGSRSAGQNDLTLRASDLPPGQFGIFIVSRESGFLPGPSGPNLCLSGGIGRIIGPGQVVQSDAAGTFSIQVDLGAIPIGGNLFAVRPGESWSFQAWHRDVNGGAPSSNLTDGTTVTFE